MLMPMENILYSEVLACELTLCKLRLYTYALQATPPEAAERIGSVILDSAAFQQTFEQQLDADSECSCLKVCCDIVHGIAFKAESEKSSVTQNMAHMLDRSYSNYLSRSEVGMLAIHRFSCTYLRTHVRERGF